MLSTAIAGGFVPVREPRQLAHEPLATSSPETSRQTPSESRQKPPLEKILDRKVHSASTFVSSQQSEAGSATPVAKQADNIGEVAAQANLPPAVLFPLGKPSSRADAKILDKWVSSALVQYAEQVPTVLKEGCESGEGLSTAVEDLVPILSVGLHEVVRQVTHQCLERGVVLERIWRTYVELFDRALAEARAALRKHKERTMRVENDLNRTRAELEQLQKRHPQQIEKLQATLAGKFEQRMKELDEQLAQLRIEKQSLQKSLKEQTSNADVWFPLFNHYKNSDLKAEMASASPVVPTSSAPEAGIAADFRRILEALPIDRRRRVGFFVSSLLGLRSHMLSSQVDTIEGLTERREHNSLKISQLESRLKELQDTLAEDEAVDGDASGDADSKVNNIDAADIKTRKLGELSPATSPKASQ